MIDSNSLTLREKIAQLMFPRIGNNLPPISTVTEDADRVAELLQTLPVGGLCIFNGHWPHTPRTISRLQQASRFPLLICADVERGAGQQVKGLTVFPDAMSLSAMASEEESPRGRTITRQGDGGSVIGCRRSYGAGPGRRRE